MLGDATVNTFNAGAGMSGSIGSRFQFAAEAGFARYLNAPMDCIFQLYPRETIVLPDVVYQSDVYLVPTIYLADYDLIYGDLTGSFNSDRLEGSAHLRVQHSRIEPATEVSNHVLPLPFFTGSAALTYNWNRRLFLGVSADWATSRTGMGLLSIYTGGYADCTIPAWVDLGANAEFRVNNRFSLWAEGRNLLNHTVMRDCLVAAKGPYFTAGICLNL
jgi:hypothetical protein